MGIPFSTKPRSGGIVLIMLCAITGFLITLYYINTNLIQYTTLPKNISFRVQDGQQPDSSVQFNLAVRSAFAIDTLPKQLVVPASKAETNILFHQNRFFAVWGMLVLVMITIASGSVPAFVNQAANLKRSFALRPRQVVIAILYAFLTAVFLVASNSSGVGYYDPPKIINDLNILFKHGHLLTSLVIATIILISPILVVVFLVGPSSDKLMDEKINKDSVERIAGGLDMLSRVLNNALYILSAIVVFTVLTTHTLGEVFHATLHIEGFDIFPSEIGYVYGIYFSLFLCVIYIPVYFYLKQQYHYFKNALAGMPYIGDDRVRILASLEVKTTAMENLKTALTVMAPLLTSFLPENLHFFK